MTAPQSAEEWIVYVVLLVAGIVVRHYFPALSPLLDRLRGGGKAPADPSRPDAPKAPDLGGTLGDALREILSRFAAARQARDRQASDEALARHIEAIIQEQGREPR